ncbi:3-hydroxyacyl-ACP dehydratase [Parapedobacter deserti]|uniref:3-hydroxyacyl-ACP dehydratase n=1 Tax=Parapedobacter deserti TaxID=1912957 RepID=A0ABV7JLH2_9SPHI
MSLISSQEAIGKLMPQQQPFVLVDRLIEYKPNHIVAGFRVPVEHILVDGGGRLTEAGVIEHFAQTIALHQGYDYFLRDMRPPVGYIGSIKNFEICQLPRVGDDLTTSIHILQQLFGVTMVQGAVKHGGQLIATGEMRTVIAKD